MMDGSTLSGRGGNASLAADRPTLRDAHEALDAYGKALLGAAERAEGLLAHLIGPEPNTQKGMPQAGSAGGSIGDLHARLDNIGHPLARLEAALGGLGRALGA